MHQLITLDLNDPRLSSIKTDTLKELPLVSCLNCSICWEPQTYKINSKNKSIEIIHQTDKHHWISEDKLPIPLPIRHMKLVNLKSDDIPLDEDSYGTAFDLFGDEYICRLLGSPLYAQAPIDRECPICKGEMEYIATITGEVYNSTSKPISGIDFMLGETYFYFQLCKHCTVLKVETQST